MGCWLRSEYPAPWAGFIMCRPHPVLRHGLYSIPVLRPRLQPEPIQENGVVGGQQRRDLQRTGPGSNHASPPLRAPSRAYSDRRGDRSPTARATCVPDWPTGHWSATRCFPLKATLFGRPSMDNGRPTYRDGSGNAADRPKSLHIALHGAGTRRPFGEMPPMRP